jgi:hypothetical protein
MRTVRTVLVRRGTWAGIGDAAGAGPEPEHDPAEDGVAGHGAEVAAVGAAEGVVALEPQRAVALDPRDALDRQRPLREPYDDHVARA